MLTRLVRLVAASIMGVGALTTLAAPVHASGPNEAMAQIAVDPEQPARLVVRYANRDGTRRGLILSDDAGKSWRLLCSDCIHEQAMAAGVVAPPGQVESFKFELRRMRSVALAKGGGTLVNTSLGLVAGDAGGCGFRAEPLFAQQDVTQLLQHPAEPGLTFALVGWEGSSQGLWRRGADGTWSRFGAAEPVRAEGVRAVYKSAALAKNDTDVRVYETVWRFEPEASAGRMSVRVSDDGAETWREYPLAADAEELELLAVDPTQRERVLGVVRRGGNSQREWSEELDVLMLSEDGGQHFHPYLQLAELSGVAFGADGTLWISDAGATVNDETRAGLFRAAPGLASAPVLLSRDAHHCVSYAAVNQTYYACQGTRVGRLDPQTGALEELVRLDTVSALATCPGVDTQRVCQDQLCTSGYCLYSHYPRAPVCALYDSDLCGPSSIRDAADAGPADAALPDAALEDAASTGEDATPREEPTLDASEPEPVDHDAGPDGASGDGCACGVGAGAGRPIRALGWLGIMAWLAVRRRRVPR